MVIRAYQSNRIVSSSGLYFLYQASKSYSIIQAGTVFGKHFSEKGSIFPRDISGTFQGQKLARCFFRSTEWKLQLRNVKQENVMKLLGNDQISVQVFPDQGSPCGGSGG